MTYDTDAIHQRIAGDLFRFASDLFPKGEKLRREGPNEIRKGKHGSLSLKADGSRVVFFDHETGQGGDVIDLVKRETQSDTKGAIAWAATWAGLSPIGETKAGNRALPAPKPKTKPEPKPYEMTAADYQRANLSAQLLGTDAKLCERIATHRQWKPETIQRLAWDCALGWECGRLAFIYATGIKHRWQQDGERRIKWATGNGSSFWRGHMRERCTRAAIICEGETDAIRLVDLGADMPERRVYALASASTWPADWKRALAGLDDVTFATDADEAGQRHLPEWAELIRPHVGKVRSVDWKAVLA